MPVCYRDVRLVLSANFGNNNLMPWGFNRGVVLQPGSEMFRASLDDLKSWQSMKLPEDIQFGHSLCCRFAAWPALTI
jgi:hypothetical protein